MKFQCACGVMMYGEMLLHSWSGPLLTCSAWSASWRMSGKEWSSSAWWSCQAGQAPPGEAEATCCWESPLEPVWGWSKWTMLVIEHQLICGASSPVTVFVILLCRGNLRQWSHRTRHAWLFRVLPEGFWGVSLDLHVLSSLSSLKALSSRCPKNLNSHVCLDLWEVWCLSQAGCILSV